MTNICDCGFPIFPQARLIQTSFTGEKEIPNVCLYKCPQCAREFKIKCFNGIITKIEGE